LSNLVGETDIVNRAVVVSSFILAVLAAAPCSSADPPNPGWTLADCDAGIASVKREEEALLFCHQNPSLYRIRGANPCSPEENNIQIVMTDMLRRCPLDVRTAFFAERDRLSAERYRAARAPAGTVTFSQALGERFKSCDGLPIYPNGSSIGIDPTNGAYAFQAAKTGDVEVRAWFAQRLQGWTFHDSGDGRFPVYWEFRDTKSPRAVKIQRKQSPIGIQYKCF
jgi:hypothetical protein